MTAIRCCTALRLTSGIRSFLRQDPSAQHCRASLRPTGASACCSPTPASAVAGRPTLSSRQIWPSACRRSHPTARSRGNRMRFLIAQTPTDVCRLHAALVLPDHRDDLLVCESALAHVSSSLIERVCKIMAGMQGAGSGAALAVTLSYYRNDFDTRRPTVRGRRGVTMFQ